MPSTPTIAVNGRFVTHDLTGVQRYGREVVGRLAGVGAPRVLLLTPPDQIVELKPGEATPHRVDPRWSGMAGHRWEQTKLRSLFRRSGAGVLLSPCNWGPLTVRDQLPVIHDIFPLIHSRFFDRDYVRWARVATPVLVRMARRIVATSGNVREQLVRHLGVDPDRVDIVPPAVGSPFTDRALDDIGSRAGSYCLFVGGDKAQKNLAFLAGFWPQVHRRLGLELWVTERAVASRLPAEVIELPGVVRVPDPSDDELVELYAGALCLLWPSLAEGFGIPLLEAMAVGTPFLSTDVGAARELAVTPDQVLPLDSALWMARLEEWRENGLADTRRRCAERARAATWERSADAMVAALTRLV